MHQSASLVFFFHLLNNTVNYLSIEYFGISIEIPRYKFPGTEIKKISAFFHVEEKLFDV